MLRILLIFNILCLLVGFPDREYSKVYNYHYTAVKQFEEKWVDASGNVNANLLIGVFEESCESKVYNVNLLSIQRVAGVEAFRYVTVPSNGFPIELSSCAEVLYYPKGHSIAHPPSSRTAEFTYTGISDWLHTDVRPLSLTITNRLPHDVTVVYQDENADPVLQFSLRPGATETIGSFLGHLFSVHRGRNTLDYFTAVGPRYVIAETARDRCRREYHARALVQGEVDPAGEVVPEGVEAGVGSHGREGVYGYFVERWVDCSDMPHLFVEYAHRLYHDKRTGLNYAQAQVGYSSVGTHTYLYIYCVCSW